SSVLVFFVFSFAGAQRPTGNTLIASVTKDWPADGRLQPGDVLRAVDGKPALSVEAFRGHVKAAGGKPIKVTVERAGKPVEVVIEPRADKGSYFVGVALEPELVRRPLGIGAAAVESVRYPIAKSALILGGLWDIVTGRVAPDAIGPVKMVDYISKSVDEGWVPAFELLAMLNVYLALFTLLPPPALGGGRLVFLVYELVTRRRPNPKVEAAVHTAGFLVLFVVMILVLFKDIKSLVT